MAGGVNGDASESVETKLVKIPELGEVKGSSSVTAWTQRKFYQFLGIRYAEPPIGKLRFKVRKSAKFKVDKNNQLLCLSRRLFQPKHGMGFLMPQNTVALELC